MAFYDDSDKRSLLNIGKMSIYFPVKSCSGSPGDSFPNNYISTVDLGNGGLITETLKDSAYGYYSAPDQSSGAGGFTPGGNDSGPASPSGNSSIVNQDTLDKLATIFCKDYVKFRSLQFDYVFAGVAEIDPAAIIDTIEFDLSGSQCQTRFYTAPYNHGVHFLGHFDAANDCMLTADPCVLFYGPPAECDGSSLVLNRYKLCIQDDRLVYEFVQQDRLS